MPTDSMVDSYIKGLAPEHLFVISLAIGILAIIAFVAVKSVPMLERIKTNKIECDKEVALKNLEIEQMREQQKNEEFAQRLQIEHAREERKADEFDRQLQADKARTEVIGKQNEILDSLTRSADSQTTQMAALMAQLEESKIRSRSMGDTIKDTNTKVSELRSMGDTIKDTNSKISELHTMMVNNKK